MDEQESMTNPAVPPFLALPSELIHHILSHLPLYDLISISLVNRALHSHSLQDTLWHALIQAELPEGAKRPPTIPTWRELYKQHHPYWFLVKNKIWFADTVHMGKLIVARYDHRINAIEAYTLVAERRQPSFQNWSHNPDAIIHTFNPRIHLDLNVPVVRLNEVAYTSARYNAQARHRFQSEIPMDTTSSGPSNALLGHQSAAIYSNLLLTRPWPSAITTPATPVWPPLTLPSSQRTRNDTPPSGFHQPSAKPSSLSNLCTSTFRLRKWMEFSARPLGVSMRVGEDTSTFATLPRASYTPTAEKPWQGIWCGDYAGHGCEFLVVRQLGIEEAGPLPARAEWALRARERGGSVSSGGSWSTAHEEEGDGGDDEEEALHLVSSNEEVLPYSSLEALHDENNDKDNDHDNDKGNNSTTSTTESSNTIYTGRIEAIKLTGDPNIPRGEYTFIAPDIGPAGLLRIATEDVFKGARIVKSVGHIAARGFRDGT